MNVLDTYQWAAAQLNDGKLIFGTPDGFERALADGFFFVQKPVGFDLSAGDRFAANFYLDRSGGDDDEYRGFRAWNAAQRRPVAAVAHRVVEQRVQPEGVPDRFSYALFVDSSLDTRQCEGLYRFDPQGGLVLATDFNTLLDKILTDTYDRDTQWLY